MDEYQVPQTQAHKIVLIVEDDELLRDLMIKKMSSEGYVVLSCFDARGAFSKLEREKPNIILLDLVLPGVDGFEILSKIKTDENLADVPVLILSNLGQQEDVDRVMALGARDFIVKANYTLDQIVARVKEVLEEG